MMSTKSPKSRVFCRRDGYTEKMLAEAARDHIAAARFLFQKSPFYYDSAGYLAHLSIELLLKAILLLVCDEFPAEHDLKVLMRLLRRKISDLEVTAAGERAVTLVNRFKEIRYPKPHAPVEIGSADMEAIVNLYNTLLRFIPDNGRREIDSEGPITKGGRVLMRKPVLRT